MAGKTMVHRFGFPPELKTTLPVAAAGMFDSASVADEPDAIVADDEPFTVMENEVGMGVLELSVSIRPSEMSPFVSL